MALLLALVFARTAAAHPGPGIVVDRAGRVYFVVIGDPHVYTIGPDGAARVFVSDPRLQRPHHLALDAAGNLYTASDHDGVVWRVGPDGQLTRYFPFATLKPVAGLLVGMGGDPFTVGPDGAVYTPWRGRGSVARIDTTGVVTEVTAPFGDLHFSAFAWGPGGVLYLTARERLWRVDPSGVVTRVTVTGAALELGVGVAVDASGAVYVADYYADRVWRIGADGVAAPAPGTERRRWAGPVGVTLGPTAELYVLDYGARGTRVYRVDGTRVRRLWSRTEWQPLIGPVLLTALLLLVVARMWQRRRGRG
jgi:streptogramin lyase